MESNSAEERALRLLEEVNGWLRFAEAKNGVLLAVAATSVVGVLQALDLSDLPVVLFYWCIMAFGFSSLSILAALASFHARVNKRGFEFFLGAERSNENVFFFGDLAKMNVATVCEEIGCEGLTPAQRKLVELIAQQIIINSKIAIWKFGMFNVGLNCFVAGLVSPIFLLLFYWVTDEKL